MKLYSVELSNLAEQDLLQIYLWIHGEAGEETAERYFTKLETAALSLQYFPERGIPRFAIAPELRILIEGNYLILYRVDGDVVEVKRIVRGSVDLAQLFN